MLPSQRRALVSAVSGYSDCIICYIQKQQPTDLPAKILRLHDTHPSLTDHREGQNIQHHTLALEFGNQPLLFTRGGGARPLWKPLGSTEVPRLSPKDFCSKCYGRECLSSSSGWRRGAPSLAHKESFLFQVSRKSAGNIPSRTDITRDMKLSTLQLLEKKVRADVFPDSRRIQNTFVTGYQVRIFLAPLFGSIDFYYLFI